MTQDEHIKMVNINARFPEDLLASLDQHVRASDLDRSKYLRQLVRRDLSANCPTPSTQPETTEVGA